MSIPLVLQNRDMSGFPVSVGTGLALEAIFQPEQESLNETPVTPLPDTSVYTLYAFNILTLIRNILSSIKSSDLASINGKAVGEVLVEEIIYIEQFFDSQGSKAKFYYNDYSYFENVFKDRIRRPTTDRQLLLDFMTKEAVKMTLSRLPQIEKFSKDIRLGKEHRCLMLSHIPADLLSFGKFHTLDLLESHTGLIKSRRTWNTKYYPVPGLDMSFLPFQEYLLGVFGDRTMIKPASTEERKKVHEHMRKLGVNPLSSEFSTLIKM